MPNRFEAARYHSLLVAAESLPPALTVTARTREGIPMALRHATQPVEGLQFHPESVLTIHGTAIMRNFIQAIGRWRTGSSWTQITAQSATRVRGDDHDPVRHPGLPSSALSIAAMEASSLCAGISTTISAVRRSSWSWALSQVP